MQTRTGFGWGTVLVLLAAYAISFVDRQILSLLVEPLKADLHLDDTRIGLLQGPAFGLFYAALGMPLGWLADRVHRVRLIAAGLALWSAATFCCGLATSFAMLFALRVAVGVGEATLVPAAVSLLADLFPQKRRALPMSVFTAGLSLGAGMALLLGGTFIAFAGHGTATLPLIGPWFAGFRPWQVAFQWAGLLGLPVIAAVLMLREPVRGRPEAGSGDESSLITYLRGHRGLFLPLLAGTTLLYLFSNALSAWMPAIFLRRHGWTPLQVGARLGILIMICAVAGNLGSGLIAGALARRSIGGAPLRAMLAGAMVMIPSAAVACLAGGAGAAVAGFACLYLGIALCFGVATAALVAVTPASLRGRMIAFYLLAGNLIGLGLGPPSVGWLTDRVFGDPRQVSLGLGCAALVTIGPAVVLLLAARRQYAEIAGEIAATEAEAPDQIGSGPRCHAR